MTKIVQNFINGEWSEATGDSSLSVENPTTGETLAQVRFSTTQDLDRAVAAANTAFRSWSTSSISYRCEPLYRLAEAIRDNSEILARTICEEMGKSLPDARAEISRTLENCRVACGMSVLIQGDNVLSLGTGIDGEVIRMPIGVFGIIGPFNFPAMVPFWFLPYAAAAGNTVLVKPSEQVPLTMARLFELLERCNFPPGVVNLINGDKRLGQSMLEHLGIAGISFVGSSKVCRTVAEVSARTGKRCQAFGSAKNYLVVMPDAKMEQTIHNMLTSCFGCAGQRCMAASVIACVGEEPYRYVVTNFVDAAKRVHVGNPLDPALAEEPLVVGPVISAAAKGRIEGLIDVGIREGAVPLLDGRGIRVEGCPNGHFIGPTILSNVGPGATVEQTEIFGPVVVLIKFHSLDEAIDAINSNPYGNGASIYTQNAFYARKFKLEARAGMIGINIGIPAPVAYLPFGGTKASLQGDTKTQGRYALDFFTERKTITQRYWPEQ